MRTWRHQVRYTLHTLRVTDARLNSCYRQRAKRKRKHGDFRQKGVMSRLIMSEMSCRYANTRLRHWSGMSTALDDVFSEISPRAILTRPKTGLRSSVTSGLSAFIRMLFLIRGVPACRIRRSLSRDNGLRGPLALPDHGMTLAMLWRRRLMAASPDFAAHRHLCRCARGRAKVDN